MQSRHLLPAPQVCPAAQLTTALLGYPSLPLKIPQRQDERFAEAFTWRVFGPTTLTTAAQPHYIVQRPFTYLLSRRHIHLISAPTVLDHDLNVWCCAAITIGYMRQSCSCRLSGNIPASRMLKHRGCFGTEIRRWQAPRKRPSSKSVIIEMSS